MVRKELLAGLIAHNLVRCVMAEAARHHDAVLERLKRKLWLNLLRIVANDPVPLRPGRFRTARPQTAPQTFSFAQPPAPSVRRVTPSYPIVTTAGMADLANIDALN
jgi:hypothetical protein